MQRGHGLNSCREGTGRGRRVEVKEKKGRDKKGDHWLLEAMKKNTRRVLTGQEWNVCVEGWT